MANQMNILIEQIIGTELSPEVQETITAAWDREFGRPTSKKKRDWSAHKEIFFLVKDSGVIVSFGCLRRIRISLGRQYKTWGVSGIVSLEKSRGYGKILMLAMKDYLEKSKTYALGLCSKKNAPFYQKCGFCIEEGAISRLINLSLPPSASSSQSIDSDMFYFPKENPFMNKFHSSAGKVIVPEFW